MKIKRIIISIVIILALIAGYRLVQLIQRKRSERNLVVQEVVIPVHLATVQVGNIASLVNFVGEIRGLNEANIYPKVSGKLLKKVVDEGAIVKTGQTIALLDRDEPAMDYKEVEITAPISGVFTGYLVDLGAKIEPKDSLGTVADTSIIKVVANIPEKDLHRIKKNDEAQVKVDAYPGQEFTGLVDMVQAKIDPYTRTAEVNIRIDNKERKLKTGMFAKGRIIEKAYQGILVPIEAVIKEQENSFVYVSDGRAAAKRQVRTGLIQESDIEITAGLKVGEQIVVVGQDNLRDGSKVEVGQ
ncbi:MAG: efflux RND transporter periplasmic adaptor subunit [bacterium]|nr:efflux RND transporter periplasmic adaptor subunit [bacterium]MDD5354612.1 efflux RND transporter periplasmic adaptor subunit [bacterium]MDD5755655.1 efflux RND transporter periplasmic adaptor subunit [bacterium]